MKDPQLAALELAAQQRYAKSGATPVSTLLAKVNAAPKQVAQDIAAKTANPMYQQWRPEFVPTPSQNNAATVSSVPPANASPVVQTAPKKNILQSIADPLTDLLATGYRAGEGIVRGAQAIGQSAMGDKEAAAETMRKINENIYKPVNIPLLGQGDVRRIGDVTESGAIAPSRETLKSLGTATELASFATPIKGSGAIGNQVFKQTGKAGLAKAAGTLAKYTAPAAISGGLATGGATLAETGDIGEAAKSALGGAAFGGIVGTALPKIAGAISKKAAPSLAEAAKINRQALAIGKSEAKKELVAGMRGQTRNMPLELAKEGVIFNTKEEAGRKIFDVADGIEKISGKASQLNSQLDALIDSKPSKTINLGSIKKRAIELIDSNKDITPAAKNALKKRLDDELSAVLGDQGFVQGDKSAMAKAYQISGRVAQDLKKVFQGEASQAYKARQFGNDPSNAASGYEALARAFREGIEKNYAGVADINKLNKELGRLAELNKFIQGYEGQIVKGGYLGRKLGGAIGVLASQAIPAPPVLREMAGYKIGEKLSDFIDDPTRKMLKASQLANPEQKVQGAVGRAVGGLLDKVPDFNVGAPAALGAGSLVQSDAEQRVEGQSAEQAATPQAGKYTPAQIGQRMKSKHPELANFSDEEIGQRMIAKHPELAQLAQ